MSSEAARPEPVVIFEETPAQRTFAEAVFSGRYRYLAFGGGIRGGKTWVLLALIFALCRIFPRSRWAIVRKDLPTLRRNTIPTFNKLRPRPFVGEINQGTWTATCTNGSEIVFFPESLDVDPDLDRWKGLEVNGFALEEANELSFKSHAKAIERAGSWLIPPETPGGPVPPQPDPLVLHTFNPAPGWVKRTFYDPWKAGSLEAPYFYLPALAADNPHLTDAYLASLTNLPEEEYRRFVQGDWESMSGMALQGLNRKVHLVEPFPIPGHWTRWASFDWGYRHPFCFGSWAKDEDGTVYLVDSVHGRMLYPDQIVERIREACGPVKWRYVAAGHDCWNEVKARGEATPTITSHFHAAGLTLKRANISRVTGLNNFRQYVRHGPNRPPRLLVLDTPGNRQTFDCWENVVTDPDYPEDALKQDADDNGKGGDDPYDMGRYGLAEYPITPEDPRLTAETRAFDPQQLAHDAVHAYRVKPRTARRSERPTDPNHGDF